MCKCPQMRSLAWAHVHTVTICDCCCISLYESHRTLKLNGNSFTLIIHICACTHLHNPLSSIRTNGRTHKHTHTSLTHKPFLVSRLHPHTHTLSLRSILSRERERGGGVRESQREREWWWGRILVDSLVFFLCVPLYISSSPFLVRFVCILVSLTGSLLYQWHHLFIRQ